MNLILIDVEELLRIQGNVRMCVHIYVHKDTCGLIDIIVRNGHGDTSSNPG